MTNIPNKRQLAVELGITRNTVDKWLRDGILPAGPPWDLAECQKARQDHESRRKKKRATRNGSEELRDAVTQKQIERITGRIDGTRSRSERLRAELEKARAGHPKRETLVKLTEVLPDKIRANVKTMLDVYMKPGPFTDPKRQKRIQKLFNGIEDRIYDAVKEDLEALI